MTRIELPSAPEETVTETRRDARVLVVDDCREILVVLEQSLTYAGYEVDTADSLAVAREKLQHGDFALVLCDVCLPQGSGTDLLHELSPSAPEIAVVMMTGNADLNLAIDCLRDGAFDFIPKPFRLEKVLQVTKRALVRQERLVAQKRIIEQRLETMARFTEDVHNPVFQITGDGKILYANKASEYLVAQWNAASDPGQIPAVLMPLVSRRFEGKEVDEEVLGFGERIYSFNVTEPVDGKHVYLYGYDTTALNAAQEDLVKLKNEALRLARTDYLTGLPNRLGFSAAISSLQMPPDGRLTAFVMMDVNKFKQINDNFGHATGDNVLVAIGKSIRRHLRASDLVFRWGGDEILLIVDKMESREAVDRYLDELKARVTEDLRKENPFEVTLSSGTAFWPDDGEDLEQVVMIADDALFRNKAAALSSWHIKRGDEKAPGDDRTDEELYQHLSTAVKGKEIDVQFQPIIDSTTNRCVSVEALARWNSRLGAVSPARFIPLADSRGLASSLGELIIEESLACLSLLRADGFEIDMSINLSQLQLQETSFSEHLIRIVDSMGLEPRWVCLEISEKYPLFNNSLYCNRIIGLREAGFQIALDDFGTGFSTLHALADLPVNRIKMDRSLTQRCGTVKGDAILASITELTRSLNLELVAEGIESEKQIDSLKSLGMSLFQGFYFQRPAPQEILYQYLKDNRS